MSLILEALRRSEAERRLGQAPDLLSPMPAAPPRRRRRWLGALAIGLTLLAVGGGAWWLGQRSAWPTVEEARAPAPAPTPAIATPSSITAEVAERETPPTAAPVAATPAAAPATPPAAPTPAVPEAAAPVAPVAAPPLPSGPASAADLAELRARLAPAAAAAAPTPAPASDAIATDLPPFASLPAGLRAGLPPLKLTMHVFNESPERRFVILDGRRLTEGAAITADLALAEIRRDGVVLDLDGRRLLLPRP